ncbi:uncharacterized protein LOC131205827 [Anopheles bellator]|uniref:uncharacterized protein LOC131205827 n=1 Tax=Anopheles bellator TaxID=139047 RepID=UPI002649E781|nr:uncharacterized protein LOC131205827 [Anopheles bellator]
MRAPTLLLALVIAVVAEARADFAVPARMAGVARGNLDGTGNVVQNSNRVLNILDQFQSITEWLYSLQTPALYRMATGFRSVMDSLVETGSPIFQALSNAARLSSGNVSSIFAGIRRNIEVAVALEDLHQLAINGTVPFVGVDSVRNFSAVLELLVRNVRNLSATMDDEIEPAIVDIQRLPIHPSQQLVDALYPREGVRQLNRVLLDYVNIGLATVPQINAVVNRVRLMDGFITRLDSVSTTQQLYLNNSLNAVDGTVSSAIQGRLQATLRALGESYNRSVTTLSGKLQAFRGESDFHREAQNSSLLLGQRLANVTQTLEGLASERVRVRLPTRGSRVVMNLTIAAVNSLAWHLTLAVTSSTAHADSCFRRYNFEFDKVPRQIYGTLSGCGQGELRALQTVTGALTGYLGVLQTHLDVETRNYDQCLGGLGLNPSEELMRQRRVCLEAARHFSVLLGGPVFHGQLATFSGLLQDEQVNSYDRYSTCVSGAYRLMATEVEYLGNSLATCMNRTTF